MWWGRVLACCQREVLRLVRNNVRLTGVCVGGWVLSPVGSVLRRLWASPNPPSYPTMGTGSGSGTTGEALMDYSARPGTVFGSRSWQGYDEPGAFAGFGFRSYGTAVGFDELSHDREADTRATG